MTVLNELLQQNRQLMEMLVAKQGSATAAPHSGSQSTMMKPVPPAEFTGSAGAGFEAWKKRLSDWMMTHYNLDVKQKAPLLMQALKGDAAALARAAVPTTELHMDDAFERILTTLEKQYGTRSSIRQFAKFRELLACSNQADGNLEAFLRVWQVRSSAAEEEGLELPDTIKAFLILEGANLNAGQLTQVLSTVQQMNPGSTTIRSADVDTALRGIAQARNIRAAGSRRPRVGLAAVEDSTAEADGDDEDEDEEDWDDNEPDPDIDDSPDFLAAVAQLRKKFRKDKGKRKGGGKDKGGGKGQKKKGPGGGAALSAQDCRWTGLDDSGDPKCFKLKENKRCTKNHQPDDLEKARAALRKKGLTPCFNAFDASSGHGFEPMTRALGSSGLADTGAKKSVCGDRWLGRYLKRLRAVGLGDKIEEMPKPYGQTFQFGGGTKTAIRRMKIPFCMELQLGDAMTLNNYLVASLGDAENGKVETRWESLVVSVVPGWLPLLFGYDSLKHHKLAILPEVDAMFAKDRQGCFRKLRNAYPCESTGVLAFELLPGQTDRKKASKMVAAFLTGHKSDSQEFKATKETTELDAAPESHCDVLVEDPSQPASCALWDAWQMSGEVDPLEGKGATLELVTTPAKSMTTTKVHESSGCDVPDKNTRESSGCDARRPQATDDNSAAALGMTSAGVSRLEFDKNNVPPDRSWAGSDKNKVPPDKNCLSDVNVAFIAPIRKDARDFPLPTMAAQEKQQSLQLEEPPTALPPLQLAEPPADVAEFDPGDLHGGETLEDTQKEEKKPKRKPVTRARLENLHVLTKHTLSLSALRKLLQRANVSNIGKALEWYRDIIDKCPENCGLAEYMHRHRLPRLHLSDLGFNQEIEMDLFKLLDIWHLIVVCRGTRWVEVCRLMNKEASTVRDAMLRLWIYRHGSPLRSVSDCGGEFLSVEFIKEMDTFGIFKEVTPAYASDRHGLVERFVRTFREAAERATRKRRKLTYTELDLTVATIQNEANNDLQSCGTSAALRAFGRPTTPFISFINADQPPPEPTDRSLLAAEAREAWRTTANDRAFQTLLHKQLGPQASQLPPDPGSLVYYRRPAQKNDGIVFRGPAEVLATSSRMEGAFLSHGGLLIRAAWEDCQPCDPTPRTSTCRAYPSSSPAAQASTESCRPPGPPLAGIPEEELDPRDDDRDPGVSLQLLPLGPGSSTATGVKPAPAALDAAPPPESPPSVVSAPVPDRPDLSRVERDRSVPEVPAEVAPPPPDDVFTIGDPSEPSTPDREAPTEADPDAAPPLESPPVLSDLPPGSLDVPPDLADWYDDTAAGLADDEELRAFGPPPEVEHHDMDTDLPVVVPDPGEPEPLLLPDPEPPDEMTPGAGPDLRPGDRIHVESTRSFTAGGKARWYIAEVFEQLPDGRTSVRWETKPTLAQTKGVDTPSFETMDLRNANWRPLRSRGGSGGLRANPQPAPDASFVAPVGAAPSSEAPPPADACGGAQAAPSEGALGSVLAAIAALEHRIEAVGGGCVQQTDSCQRNSSAGRAGRCEAPARSILTALLAHAPRRVSALPVVADASPPSSLSALAVGSLEELEDTLTSGTPELDKLESVGAAVADSLHGHLDTAMYAYLDKDVQHCTSDATALATLNELGLRYAPPKESTWETELLKRTNQTILQSNNEELSMKLAGELLVIIEHGIARLQGLETATIAAVATQDAPALGAAALDTAVYQYDQSDLTDEMKLDAAKNELDQYKKYGVWGSEPSTKEDVPKDATVLDTKYFDKPKMKNGKLIAKGRLTPRPFNDPERFDYRNDSPAVSKATLFTFLSMVLSFGWQIGKVDVSGAFLQGDPLDRDIWIELPKILIQMGLVDPIRRFRKILKGVYGLNQAPRLWFVRLCKFLCTLGFAQSLIDPCLFILMRDGVVVALVAVYVDDLLVGGKTDVVREVLAALDGQFTTGAPELSTDVKQMSYTGKDLSFSCDSQGRLTEIRIDQKAYIDSKLAPSIPEPNFGKRTAQEPLKPKECDAYRELQGKLAWTGNTRMDIAVDVSEGAGAAHAPTVGDMKRNIKIAKHVAATAARAIVLRPIELAFVCIVLFADGSWANEGNRTKGGHGVFLADRRKLGSCKPSTACLLTWLSATLKRVCTSTFDSETLSLLRGVDDLTALAFLVSEMRYGRLPNILERALVCGFGMREVPRPRIPMFAYCDGKSVIDAIYSSRWQIKSKRRRVDLASLRESGEQEYVQYSHCETGDMVMDGLTKIDPKLKLALERAMAGEVSFP